MYKVVTKRFLNDAKSICLFEVEAPLVARHAQAGQFVIFRLDEQGERVPVSVAGYDREKGTVTVMVQAAGKTTKMLLVQPIKTRLPALVQSSSSKSRSNIPLL